MLNDEQKERIKKELREAKKKYVDKYTKPSHLFKSPKSSRGILQPDYKSASGNDLAPLMAFKMVINMLIELLEEIEYEFKHHPNTHYTAFDIKKSLFKRIDKSMTPMYNLRENQHDWWFLIYETVSCNLEHFSAYYAPSLYEHLDSLEEFDA